MLELLELTFYLGKIFKKSGLKEEEIVYCCFIFIHIASLAIGDLAHIEIIVLLIMIAIPLFLGAVAALIIGVSLAIKNWRNWKLQLLIILPLSLFAIYKIFDSMSPDVFGVLLIIYHIVMVLLPSWWLITSRRNQLNS